MTQFLASKQASKQAKSKLIMPLALLGAVSLASPTQAALITLNVSGEVYETTFPTVAIGDAFQMTVQYDDAVFPQIIDDSPNDPNNAWYSQIPGLTGEMQIGDDPVQSLDYGDAWVFSGSVLYLRILTPNHDWLVEYLFSPGAPLADDSLSGAFQAAIAGQISHPNHFNVSYGDGNGISYDAWISNINSSLSYNTPTPPTNVPLPASSLLLSSALAIFGLTGKRRRKA